MSDELIAFVRAQLDEDERVAREASQGPWTKDRADSVYAKETSVVTRPPTPEANRPEWLGPFDYVVPPDSEGSEGIEPADAEHIAHWDPTRALAEVEAKRRILAQYDEVLNQYRRDVGDIANAMAALAMMGILKALAQPYAGRPGWREEWRV